MIDPSTGIVGGILFLGIIAIVLYPRKGLFARWQSARLKSERILIEDALKFISEKEYQKSTINVELLTKALSVSYNEVKELITRLESLNLIEVKDKDLTLTEEGRSYALRIVRIHRLWEQYLADQTSVSEADWHTEAERREHFISSEDAEKIAKHLGQPLYDPHGDPIPTISGTLPDSVGKTLDMFAIGERGRIGHIEDEPPAVYAQLVALALHPGLTFRVIHKSAERIIFDVADIEIVLAPVVAANITAVPLTEVEKLPIKYKTLKEIHPGESAVVIEISPICRGLQRRRLMDLGIIPGTTIKAELKSVSGNLTSYNIRGASIALRTQQAEMIFIE